MKRVPLDLTALQAVESGQADGIWQAVPLRKSAKEDGFFHPYFDSGNLHGKK